MKKWMAGVLFLISIVLVFSTGQGQESSQRAGETYDSGMELFHSGKYEDAIEAFFKLIDSHPGSRLVSYSQFMIGQCYLKMEKFEAALKQFSLYLKTYPEGDRVKAAEQGMKVSEEKLKERSRPGPAPQPAPSVPASPTPGTVVETGPAPEEPKLTEPKIIVEEIKEVDLKPVNREPEKGMAKVAAKEAEAPEIKPPLSGEKPRRRICAQIFYFDGTSLEAIEKKVKELKEAGVDTLIVRVFQNRGDRTYKIANLQSEEGVYFKTEYAPVVADILGSLAEMVHRNGLEIFAWMTTRLANYGSDIPTEYRSKVYNFGTKKIETGRGFNLFHPEVLMRLKGLYRDLGRYPIDGILFQDDLILKHNEDFSPEATKAFLQEFGYAPHPDILYVEPFLSESGRYVVKGYTDQFQTWANWKSRRLMEVAEQLMEAARESNRGLKFGINLYFEAVSNPPHGAAWFSQSLSEALKRGFDYYAVMAYHREAMKDLKLDEKKAMDLMAEVARKAVQSVGSPNQVMMKIQLVDWKSNDVVPRKEAERVLEKVLKEGEVSLAFVPYTDLFPLHLLHKRWAASSK
jgi:tetratricopeptide (TPR) repeat protein